MALSKVARMAQREYKRQWSKENREHLRNYHREWRKRNKDKTEAANERYWQKKAMLMQNDNVTLPVTGKKDISVTSVTGAKTCLYCGKEFYPKRNTAKYCSDNCRVQGNRSK